MEDIRAAFGRRVREVRHGLGLSQEDLADRAGLHWTYVGGVERGERNLSLVSIARLAEGLGLSLAALFEPFSAIRRGASSAPEGARRRPKRAVPRSESKPRRPRPTKP